MGGIQGFKRAVDTVLQYLKERTSSDAEWVQLGLSINEIGKVRAYLEEKGYIERDGERYRLTAAGLAYITAGRGLTEAGLKVLDFLFAVYPGKAELVMIGKQTGVQGDDLKTVLKLLEAKGYIELEEKEGKDGIYGYARLTPAGVEILTSTQRKVKVW